MGDSERKESQSHGRLRASTYDSDKAISKGRQGKNGRAWMGESAGARERSSASALRREAVNAEDDIAVRGNRPIPACLSERHICWIEMGESWEGCGRRKISVKVVQILLSNWRANRARGAKLRGNMRVKCLALAFAENFSR